MEIEFKRTDFRHAYGENVKHLRIRFVMLFIIAITFSYVMGKTYAYLENQWKILSFVSEPAEEIATENLRKNKPAIW